MYRHYSLIHLHSRLAMEVILIHIHPHLQKQVADSAVFCNWWRISGRKMQFKTRDFLYFSFVYNWDCCCIILVCLTYYTVRCITFSIYNYYDCCCYYKYLLEGYIIGTYIHYILVLEPWKKQFFYPWKSHENMRIIHKFHIQRKDFSPWGLDLLWKTNDTMRDHETGSEWILMLLFLDGLYLSNHWVSANNVYTEV